MNTTLTMVPNSAKTNDSNSAPAAHDSDINSNAINHDLTVLMATAMALGMLSYNLYHGFKSIVLKT